MQDKWPYLSLLPEQRTGEPSIAVGGVNTVVPIVVRVPRTPSEGPDGNPEVALGYEVRERGPRARLVGSASDPRLAKRKRGVTLFRLARKNIT